MNFLNEAQEAYNVITCKTIRSMLYECAAEALRRIIQSRTSASTLDSAQPQSRIEIMQEDVDQAYDVTHKIGRRWAEKLITSSDDGTGNSDQNRAVSKIVKMVLRNGHFLDTTFCDDLSQLKVQLQNKHCEEIGCNDCDVLNGSEIETQGEGSLALELNNNGDPEIYSDASSEAEDIPTINTPTPKNTTTAQGGKVHRRQQTHLSSEDRQNITNGSNNTIHAQQASAPFRQSIPYTSLLRIGQLDPCNLHVPESLQSDTNVSSLYVTGLASEWHPLPALGSSPSSSDAPSNSAQNEQSSSLVHIPNPTMLPPEQIQALGQASNSISGSGSDVNTNSDQHENQNQSQNKEQLYGLPALRMPKPMDIREQIARIDELARDIDNSRDSNDNQNGERGQSRKRNAQHGHTMWPFDWNIIEEQAVKNRDRLHPPKSKRRMNLNGDGMDGKEVMEVIPKSLLGDDLVSVGVNTGNDSAENIIDDNNGAGAENGAGTRGDDMREGNDAANVSTTNTDDGPVFVEAGDGGNMQRVSATKAFQKTYFVSKVFGRKWGEYEDRNGDDRSIGAINSDGRDQRQGAVAVGRRPYPYGEFRWTSQEIKDNLGERVRADLEKSMLHDDEDKEKHYHSCQGALKMVGNIHLWEQISSNQWKGAKDVERENTNDNQDGGNESDEFVDRNVLKMRKAAHRKAKRQRLYPHQEAGTKSYHDSNYKSKVVRAEEGKEGIGANCDDGLGNGKRFIELDLAECIISLIPTSCGDDDSAVKKKQLAFRSLEISLTD